MTVDAPGPCCHVLLVIEKYVVGNFVHTYPRNRRALPVIPGKRLKAGLVGFLPIMADHAPVAGRNSCMLPVSTHFMAKAAPHGLIRMLPVAERKRLFWRGRRWLVRILRPIAMRADVEYHAAE